MEILTKVALYIWIPFVLFLFALLPPRRAVISAFILAWLFLPEAQIKFQGLPDFTKTTATCVGVLLAVFIFDINRLLSFRPSIWDIPMLAWCLEPIATSISNGLGSHDGFSWAFMQTVSWFLPYFIGRLYFKTLSDFHELAIGIFIGGLIYVPFCLYEIRMSPQLHKLVYGYNPHSFAQTKRWGGYRPQVFMQHGLMVGMWMCTASLIGIWLWSAKLLKPIWGIPPSIFLCILVFTFIFCKSTGAILLFGLGVSTLYLMRQFRSPIPILLLILVPPLYIFGRTSGVLTGASLTKSVESLVGADRAKSFAFRLKSEDLLSERALKQKWVGWGRFSRSHVVDDKGKELAVSDGMWIIALGQNGVIGLAVLTVALLLPPIILLRHFPARYWSAASLAPAAVLAMVLVLYVLDCLMNAMINPIYLLAAGGLATLRPSERAIRRVAHAPQASTRLSNPINPAPAFRGAKRVSVSVVPPGSSADSERK